MAPSTSVNVTLTDDKSLNNTNWLATLHEYISR